MPPPGWSRRGDLTIGTPYRFGKYPESRDQPGDATIIVRHRKRCPKYNTPYSIHTPPEKNEYIKVDVFCGILYIKA